MSVSNGMGGLVVVTWQRSNKERDTTKMKFFALPMDGSVIKPSGRPKEAWLNKCAFAGGHKIVKNKNYTGVLRVGRPRCQGWAKNEPER